MRSINTTLVEDFRQFRFGTAAALSLFTQMFALVNGAENLSTYAATSHTRRSPMFDPNEKLSAENIEAGSRQTWPGRGE